MPTEQFANNISTTLNGALTSSTNPVVVASAAGFPSVAQYRILIDSEIMIVTAGAGTTSWTVTRGAEGTTAASHSNGATVAHILTAGALARWVPNSVIPPRNHQLLAMAYDPVACGSGVVCVSGTVYAIRVPVPETLLVTNIVTNVSVIGATLTSGQNVAGLYSQTGVQIGVTADQSSAWTSTGQKVMALTGGPFSVTGGPDAFCYVLIMSNGGTPASFNRGATNNVIMNIGLAAADGYRFGATGTGQTALPASFTVSSLSIAAPLSFWVGLS